MSADVKCRYVVRQSPAIPPAEYFYVLDLQQSPPKTAAICDTRPKAELVREALELHDVATAFGLVAPIGPTVVIDVPEPDLSAACQGALR